MTPRPARFTIDDVRPTVTGGTCTVKATVGEAIPVSALVWREGHDAVAATLNVWREHDPATVMSTPMSVDPDNPDRFHGVIWPDEQGTWIFRIDAWGDPIATWKNAVVKKMAAGQDIEELANDLAHGSNLFGRAALNAPRDVERTLLKAGVDLVNKNYDLNQRVSEALSPAITEILTEYPLRDMVVAGREQKLLVERKEARFNSWYELFPRSTGGWDSEGNPVHGTFASTALALERVAAMGFDTVYFPPIHPIGHVHRKGKNNSLHPTPDDVGSPWAIQDHCTTHPALGTMDDFCQLVARAEELGLEVALDLALQAAPDHPWAKEHPEFFTVLADGTIAYAENPPKKYQDIYPINFDNDPEGLRAEIYRMVMTWVNAGVRTFRVDNPHTKPANFWAWLIETVHKTHPDIIFLAEAFTRPARLFGLAKHGFTQSYSYFTWKTTKTELEDFVSQHVELADICRPNLFVNTPDILHESLQTGGRAMFAIRAVLAATLSPLWGMYSGFELFEHQAVSPGSEEYLDSEKYELRPRDFQAAINSGDSLENFIRVLNQIRREHPALQQLRLVHFHDVDNSNVMAYSKVDPATGDAILVVINLDPRNVQEATVSVNLAAIGQNLGAVFSVSDHITGAQYQWSERNFVRLTPQKDVAHIFVLPPVSEDRRERLAWRTAYDYRP
ncbi:MAG: maltotransferase domain-containing protein [Corynebacterium sp.]|nr:maltotransferase domain-containing protein [Corynebacterium sp.]